MPSRRRSLYANHLAPRFRETNGLFPLVFTPFGLILAVVTYLALSPSYLSSSDDSTQQAHIFVDSFRVSWDLPPLQTFYRKLNGTTLPDDVRNRNNEVLDRLWDCVVAGKCSEEGNERNVVLLGAKEFTEGWAGIGPGGSNAWAASIVRTISSLGYSAIIYNGLNETRRAYEILAPYVAAVLLEPGDIKWCYHEARCIKQQPIKDVPASRGIPLWKMFAFTYNSTAQHPFGSNWTLSPEYLGTKNYYIGYSIDDVCPKDPTLPSGGKSRQAFVLAKEEAGLNQAWSKLDYLRLKSKLGVSLVSSYTPFSTPSSSTTISTNSTLPPSPIEHLPPSDNAPLTEQGFLDALRQASVVIGTGSPYFSAEPYEALCRGTPFINPVLSHDPANPGDRSRWKTQHPVLQWLDPPLVYNVFLGDSDGLTKAVAKALEHPINRYILPHMDTAAMRARVEAFVETDWRGMASGIWWARHRNETTDGINFVL